MPGSTSNFALKYVAQENQSGGAHSSATQQQPGSGGAGGGGFTAPSSADLISNVAGTVIATPGVFNVASFASVNAAIAALNANGGGRLVFNAGAYTTAAAYTPITVPCEIAGQGLAVTTITQTSGTANLFTLKATSACWIHDLNLVGGGTTGYGIAVGTGAIFSPSHIIERCQIGGFGIGINFINAAFSIVSKCTIAGNGYGVAYACPYNPDESAGMIEFCTIGANTSAGLVMNNADGLQIVGNYFQGSPYAILINQPNQGLSDLWIIGNHIENYTVAGVFFNAAGTSSVLSKIVIVGNDFADANGTTGPAIGDASAGSGSGTYWLQDMTLVGNVIYSQAAYAVRFYFLGYSTIEGNRVNNTGGIGIGVAATCAKVILGQSNQLNTSGNGAADLQSHKVADLPANAQYPDGQRFYVTDSNATLAAGIGNIVATGGANIVPVVNDGTNWRIG